MLDYLATARCCRDWPVIPYMGIGRCGYCGQRPEVVVDTDPVVVVESDHQDSP